MTRLFGTNGIRWTVGKERDTEFSTRLGLAIGSHFGAGSKVSVGTDTRTSSPLIFKALSSGLMACGVSVIDLGVAPTPVVQYAVPRLGADGGIVVTASHNPPEFNGVKCIAADGTEIARKDEICIEDIYANAQFARADWKGIGALSVENCVQENYRRRIIENAKMPDKENILAIVDCANGTAGPFTPEILKNIGCKVKTLNAQPDGCFPGRLPEPTKENIQSLMMAARCDEADFGVAHDGDADRAIFVDEKGNYVTGDQSLAIFSLNAMKAKGGKVVTPINTSKVVEDVVHANGGEIVSTPIGSPFIARHMKDIGAAIGGEGNGGVIFPEHQYCRDGIVTAVKMAVILAGGGKPLSELVTELPEYHLQRTKLALPAEMSRELLMQKVKQSADGEVVDIDGVKIINDDHWILVRFSGTEPVLRVTVESDSASKTSELLSENKKKVEEIICSLSS